MRHNVALNRDSCSGFAVVVLMVALAVGFTACSFDSSGLDRFEHDNDVMMIDGGDADAFDPEIGSTDVRDAQLDIATDTGLDAEMRDTSDIDDVVATDAQDDEILGDATLDSDELGDDVEVGDTEIETGDTVQIDVVADAGSDALTDVVVEDVTTDAPAETEGDTELDSADSSDTEFVCERDSECGFGQICWMGECLVNQACNPFSVTAEGVGSQYYAEFYSATNPVPTRAGMVPNGTTLSDSGECSVVVGARAPDSECTCMTHFGSSACAPLPASPTALGCVHNQPATP